MAASNLATMPLTRALEKFAGSLAAVLNDMLNRSCGKVVIDRDNNTVKVYDTNGSTLMFTLTMGTAGNVDTLTRT